MTGTAEDAARTALAYECPDCNADVTQLESNGSTRGEVRHDPTCPYLAAMSR